MSILFRYIARLYFLNVCTLLFVLFLLVVSVDAVVNLRRFAASASEQMAGHEADGLGRAVHHALLTAVLVFDIWGPRLLQLFSYLIGVVLVAAMGFTCAQLVRHREFVALLSGGISLHRAALPFLAVGALFIGAQALNSEVFVPAVAPLLTRDAGDAGKRNIAAFRVRLAEDGEGRVFYSSRFDDKTGTLADLHVWERNAEGRLVRAISAKLATWDGRGWVLEDGWAEPLEAPPPTDPRGSPATPSRTRVERIDSSLDPTRLKVMTFEGFGQSLSWRRVDQLLRMGGLDPHARDRLERIRWGRIAALASNFITLTAALPFFLIRAPRPLLIPSLQCAPVALAGLTAAALASTLAIPGLPPWLGAFIPSLVLLPVAIALYTGVRT